VGRHTPKVVLFDTNAQPVILGAQFAKKMGMFNSKLRKSMWQICIASKSIKEVLSESLDLITLNLCSLGKMPYFHQVSQLTTGLSMRTTKWIKRLMTTTWDTYPLIYMGTIVLWLTIVCSRKHTPFPTSNKLAMSG
jgi:hypothetical protein